MVVHFSNPLTFEKKEYKYIVFISPFFNLTTIYVCIYICDSVD